IVLMDYVDLALTTSLLNKEQLNPAIHATLGLTKHTLNKYHSSIDLSKLYQIMMVLHPHHTADYFKQAAWMAEWILTAQDLVHDTFE
ncbi:hypothetical protein SCLCIDRAFT_122105, partial [Scleroderma citrinum Foug A]